MTPSIIPFKRGRVSPPSPDGTPFQVDGRHSFRFQAKSKHQRSDSIVSCRVESSAVKDQLSGPIPHQRHSQSSGRVNEDNRHDNIEDFVDPTEVRAESNYQYSRALAGVKELTHQARLPPRRTRCRKKGKSMDQIMVGKYILHPPKLTGPFKELDTQGPVGFASQPKWMQSFAEGFEGVEALPNKTTKRRRKKEVLVGLERLPVE